MSLIRYKLVFFSPPQVTRSILDTLFSKPPQTLGKIGDYERCAFVSRGTGQFKPTAGASPSIGSVGELEFVEEDRVEVLVIDKGQKEEVRSAIRELKAVHPYEEVAFDVYRLEDF